MNKKIKKKDFSIDKEDFIEFLATSSPEEINQYIMEKGKPRKLIEGMIFFNHQKHKGD